MIIKLPGIISCRAVAVYKKERRGCREQQKENHDHPDHNLAPADCRSIWIWCILCLLYTSIGKFENLLINLIRLLRDNEQRMLLISLMQHLNHLSRSKLEDNRVKRSVPSKEQTCHCQDHCISTQNIIPDIPAIFLGKINRNKAVSYTHLMERQMKDMKRKLPFRKVTVFLILALFLTAGISMRAVSYTHLMTE